MPVLNYIKNSFEQKWTGLEKWLDYWGCKYEKRSKFEFQILTSVHMVRQKGLEPPTY